MVAMLSVEAAAGRAERADALAERSEILVSHHLRVPRSAGLVQR